MAQDSLPVRIAERSVELLMALDLTLIVVLVFSNVVSRYGFGAGFAGAEEVSRLLFVWLVFLGAVLALRRQAHLGVELLQARLPRPLRRACAVLSHLGMLYALWLFLAGSWTQVQIGLTTYSTVLHYPNAFMAASGLVCAASMLFIVAANLLRILMNHPGAQVPGEPAHEAQAATLAQEGAE
ncbi:MULTISPECIES: TRAP transporter small permease [Ramlibacter]|uniref:TRAP transporter small permease protein n=1 Tax=Ramlibacter aquaticus TaxID=2780094 RepID=A0ABR9SGM4_9BURK|nr:MULTISPECIES: TRAP transporter small permease [Ramlibacter]MBE7941420.1 TRAP transporter small permease [Ramlibacter aquaticus]